MEIKLMTFNTQHCLNYLEQKIDFPIMADTIRRFDADIVGLNEMYFGGDEPDFSDQVGTLAERCGYTYHYFGVTLENAPFGQYGIGMMSRVAPESIRLIEIPSPDDGAYHEPRAIIKARFQNGLTVLVSHFGLTDEEKKNAVETALSHTEKEKCVLMGDLNMTPDCEILRPIFEAMKDTASVALGECLSFPSPAPIKKIDYIFVSRDVTVLDADVPAVIASDHRPHIAHIHIDASKE